MKHLILGLLLCVTANAASPPIVADPKWKEFGSYLNQLADKVQVQWERQLIEKEQYPPADSTVSVTFVLNAQGTIVDVTEVKSASSPEGAAACASAITAAAPYGPWTPDMKKVLGERQSTRNDRETYVSSVPAPEKMPLRFPCYLPVVAIWLGVSLPLAAAEPSAAPPAPMPRPRLTETLRAKWRKQPKRPKRIVR